MCLLLGEYIVQMKNNILIIGGAGYIGSHTALAIKELGFKVIIYDNFSTGHRDSCFGDVTIEGDISDTKKLLKTLVTHKVDCVIHFAALIEAGISVIDPISYYQNNVAGTLSLLEAMQAADVRKIVFSSTAAVYGSSDQSTGLSENLPKLPISPYGYSKAMVEVILENCVKAHGFQAIALRYFNACGADPLGRTGERHNPETHLIPLTIQAAQKTRDNIKIFGTDYATEDGSCVRDYIHVSDLADGHIAAATNLLHETNPKFIPINLGTGSGFSVRQIINTVKEVSGLDFPVIEDQRRDGDPAILVADVSKAKSILGWQAKHSSIDNIILDAWNYAQKIRS